MSDLPVIYLSDDKYCDIPDFESHGKYITERGVFYWENGKQHRLDGPAVEYIANNKYKAFYIYDKHYDERSYWEEVYRIYLYKNGLEDYE